MEIVFEPTPLFKINTPEDDVPELYNVIVKSTHLSIVFTVIRQDPTTHPREFDAVKPEHLYIYHIKQFVDRNTDVNLGLSADISVVQSLFSEVLDEFGIVLDKVNVHNKNYFDSVDFHFSDPTKTKNLLDQINSYCCSIIKNIN